LSDFCITSFLEPALHAARAIHPQIRTGLIFARWNKSIRSACVSPDIDLLVAHYRLVDYAEQIGKPLLVWTVDAPARTRRLFKRPSVEGIVTNDPRQAVAIRRETLEN
jgi:glycerophosphoryl diester phosphodiesterase